jgi:hypothetical protein
VKGLSRFTLTLPKKNARSSGQAKFGMTHVFLYLAASVTKRGKESSSHWTNQGIVRPVGTDTDRFEQGYSKVAVRRQQQRFSWEENPSSSKK